MSRWSEREIARKLAERDELEPPPGLLEKIKSEIPPMIPAGTGVPEIDRRPSMPPRQRWLIAASLVAMIGAGVFALHLGMEVQPPKLADRLPARLERRQVLDSPAPPPAKPAPERQAFQHQLREAPAAKPQLQRKELEALKSLGYISPRDKEEEKKAERGAPAGRPDSVAGGEPAAPPATAPPPPPPPPPAEAPVPPPAEAPAVQAAPLLDGRRAGTGTSQPSRGGSSGTAVTQSELEKAPTARDPWSAVQSAPGVATDRINVGGNESGRQSYDFDSFGEVPGSADRPQPAQASRAKVAGADSAWQVPSSQPITLETAAGTASYDLAHRSIAGGKLPDPGAIRIGEVVNAFETGDVPPVEGASTPFVHGPQYRLLRVHPGGAGPAQVSFNPSVVVRYRSIGTGGSALYEIELRPGVSPQNALVAVLHLGSQGKAVTAGELASSWDKASPGFRLAALAAEFAEILKGSPVDSSALHRLSAEIAKLPKGPKVAELRKMVERVEKIQQSR